MMNVDEIKNALVGNEYSFRELDNFMVKQGYFSVFDDGITDFIKNGRRIIYANCDLCRATISIDFEITIDNGDDEIEENFYLKVANVEQFDQFI